MCTSIHIIFFVVLSSRLVYPAGMVILDLASRAHSPCVDTDVALAFWRRIAFSTVRARTRPHPRTAGWFSMTSPGAARALPRNDLKAFPVVNVNAIFKLNLPRLNSQYVNVGGRCTVTYVYTIAITMILLFLSPTVCLSFFPYFHFRFHFFPFFPFFFFFIITHSVIFYLYIFSGFAREIIPRLYTYVHTGNRLKQYFILFSLGIYTPGIRTVNG